MVPKMLAGFLISVFLPVVPAVEITACNCSSMSIVGALALSDITDCEDTIKPAPPQPVQYEIYTNQRGAQEFVGFACRRVPSELILRGNVWVGSYAPYKQQIEEAVSPAECFYMKETLNCLDNKMTLREGTTTVWEYNKQPEGDPRWNDDIMYKETNCIVEELILHRECEDCPILSPYGSLGNTSEAHVVLNHITIVWNGFNANMKECEFLLIGKGSGLLSNVTGEHPFLLKDKFRQVDFLLSNDTDSPCPVKFSGKVKQLRGSSSVYVNVVTPKFNGERKRKTLEKFDLPEREYAVVHLQYEEDEAIARENALAAEINALNCELKKMKRDQILQTARSSGILAAKQLGLPECQYVQPSLKTAVVFQCHALKISVAAVRSSCGWQPKYLNYSIAHDGYRLVPYSSCVWTSSYVVLNENIYGIQNDSWHKIEPNMKLAHQVLINHFNITADDSINWLPQEHRQDHMYTDHENAIADWVSTLHDNGIKRTSEFHEMTSPATNFITKALSKWWGISESTLVGTVTALFVSVLIVVFTCLCGCCCRVTNCSRLLFRYSSNEIKEIRESQRANGASNSHVLPLLIGRVESTSPRGGAM